jgi:acyl-CoA synthetase (AMP-forming)/AMP-acid ligase II
MHGWPAQRKPMREMMEAEGLELSGVRGLRDEYLPDGSLKQPDQSPNSLGMTESFGPHCASPAGSVLPEHRRGAFGPVIGGYDRRVVDPATGEVAPYGQVGELQLRGAALMSGYYKRERSEVFTPDGYFPTHDLVRFEPDGYMYFEGRTGDMLKTKGANVSRVEVEVALRNLDGVSVAVVCGLPDPVLGQRIVAAVVPSPGADPKEPDLKAELAERLAGYKIPTHILFIDRDDLMWTASGKVRIPEMGKLIAERLGLNA